jgi:putative restriction endonuclease
MRERIAHYRKSSASKSDDFEIGCRILTQPFFFGEDEWIPVPADWSPNIVSLKTYATDTDLGLKLWTDVVVRLQRESRLPDADP